MAAAAGFLTPQQFDELYGDRKPYFEYWFGEAIEKSVPSLEHGVMQWVLAMLLSRYGWRAATELRLKISALAYPVPDVVADDRPLKGPYPMEAFELCVEILSPGDDLPKVFRKCAHYLDWGIRRVWIIDPKKRSAYMMSLANPQPAPVGMSESLVAGSEGAEIVISMGELFEEMDRQLGG